ncbi:hypothetical protein BD626DRAFT_634056 [Schizophyllum amplum]|uniref:F-box domain-containing protein n=1 Tax=Schizophyllum amplum TaxID=97359 RepID=A0A550C0P0_9AGAR|nr:hypothetical protein BD626DRAFT_634056 [Auriculariopsis ampla]
MAGVSHENGATDVRHADMTAGEHNHNATGVPDVDTATSAQHAKNRDVGAPVACNPEHATDTPKDVANVIGAREAWLKTFNSTNRKLLLAELPLELVYEILTSLHPADLLSVSRLNKTLRHVLLHKSARWIWMVSFQSVRGDPAWEDAYGGPGGCPKIPNDLNEPQFAHFLFDDLCMKCGSPDADFVAWNACMRYCDECANGVFCTLQSPTPDDTCYVDDQRLFVRTELIAFVAALEDCSTDDERLDLVVDSHLRCQQIYGHIGWLANWKHERDSMRRDARTVEGC